MNPDERILLERTLKLAEENNKILHKVESRAKRAAIYGFIKLVLIVLPFVIGYFLLEPYLDEAQERYSNIQELVETFSNLPR
jgi:hypothetical protein